MKIAILSCFYPFRGGIAQFNANLLEELGKRHEVKAFNFSRQYPSLLFPGKTQYVSPEDEAKKVEYEAVLDTANPLSWASAAAKVRKWNPQLLLMRYWMPYFGASLGFVARSMAEDCKVIAITDNIIPHERRFFDKLLTKYFLNSTDACVALCEEVASELLNLKPEAKYTVIPHPVYSHFGSKLPKEEAEKLLGLPSGSKNILFFGLIRDYKGLDVLIEAFGELKEDYRLIIAGEAYGSFEKYERLIAANPNASRIHPFPKYIRDSEVKHYFSAADVVVLPYRSASQSGIGAIADNFEVPMIVSNVGGLRETIGERGKGIVCSEYSPQAFAANIREFFEKPELGESCRQAIREFNSTHSWENFCTKLLNFVNSIDS